MSQPNSNSITPPTVVKATLKAMPNGKAVAVHFNPASLVYTVENSSPQQGGDPKRRQFAAQFTGKLTMDLQFDTTDTGTDVRKDTTQVAMFMQASAGSSKKGDGSNPPAPPVLSFDWGAYHFQGFMESFKETIDFFSADGIPLRSLVSIGLARQDNVFDAGPGTTTAVSGSLVPTAGGGSGAGPAPPTGPQSSGSSATAIASQGGDPNAGRALASANDLENPRFTGGASLEVGGGIQLNAAVGFVASASVGGGIGASAGAGFGVSGGLGLSLTAGASAGVGFGLSGSAGASVSGGFGLSGGAGVSVGAGVSLGVGATVSTGISGQVTLAAGGGAIFGSKASAGVAATQGAFAGLEVGRVTVSTTTQLDPLRMLPATVGSDVSVSSGASFGLGGMALSPAGFSTNVGTGFSFNDRLTFDGD